MLVLAALAPGKGPVLGGVQAASVICASGIPGIPGLAAWRLHVPRTVTLSGPGLMEHAGFRLVCVASWLQIPSSMSVDGMYIQVICTLFPGCISKLDQQQTGPLAREACGEP